MAHSKEPRILYLAKLSPKNEGEIKTFPDKQKLIIHCSNTCPIRNTTRESFQEKRRVLDSKSNSHKDLRSTSKGNYTIQTSVLIYLWLMIPGFSNNFF